MRSKKKEFVIKAVADAELNLKPAELRKLKKAFKLDAVQVLEARGDNGPPPPLEITIESQAKRQPKKY